MLKEILLCSDINNYFSVIYIKSGQQLQQHLVWSPIQDHKVIAKQYLQRTL